MSEFDYQLRNLEDKLDNKIRDVKRELDNLDYAIRELRQELQDKAEKEHWHSQYKEAE